MRCQQIVPPFGKVKSCIQSNLHILSKWIYWGRKLLVMLARKNQEQRSLSLCSELYGQLPVSMNGCVSVF